MTWDKFFQYYLGGPPPSSSDVMQRFHALTDRLGLPRKNLTGDDLNDLLPVLEHIADRLAVIETR